MRLPDGTRSILGSFETEAEARGVIAAAAEQLAAAGSTIEANVGITLAAFGSKWLERRENEGKRNAHSERSCWNNHVAKERFAQGPIGTVTRRDIRDWVRALTQRRVTHARALRAPVAARDACCSRRHCAAGP